MISCKCCVFSFSAASRVKGLCLLYFIKPRKCLNRPDIFCYECGEVTFRFQKLNFTPLIKKCYKLYFVCKMADQDKSWAPHICCVTCARLLTGWVNFSHRITFAVTTIWREPKDRLFYC